MADQVAVIAILLLIQNIYCGYDYSCDYKFGDPSWDYAQVFHDKTHIVPAGIKSYTIDLSKNSLIICFVCVNISDISPNNAAVSFVSLFKSITVDFNNVNSRAVKVHVLAMHHGYRRKEEPAWTDNTAIFSIPRVWE
ncbi:uncharacterized protein LOC125075404 [Vanessa atalanta]|uniref:uncharacterized protein LOC125075404 n=1 Tax=Vanessa atalanta TaxID=42275 RepID=UPI001FCE1203|nr:uncharacterized protein LOC125075404 [Vanessa atalanta]